MNRNAIRDMYFTDDSSKNIGENVFVVRDRIAGEAQQRGPFVPPR